MDARKLFAETLGTAALVFVAVGAATLSFGFKLTGTSPAAGVAVTALAFGLTLLALAYMLGPVSGAHVNPAVTLGFLLTGRMRAAEAAGYMLAQVVGATLGALALWAVVASSPDYSRSTVGLGADGWGKASMISINAGGAFVAETVLTFLFVLVVLVATSRLTGAGFAGIAVGLALTAVHLVGIPLTGTSVNPARSIGPALIVGHTALAQLWLFILAPLLGGALAAGAYRYLVPATTLHTGVQQAQTDSQPVDGEVGRTRAAP